MLFALGDVVVVVMVVVVVVVEIRERNKDGSCAPNLI